MKKKNIGNFFAMFFRQKYINRWGLMRNVTPDTLSSHASEVAAISHALAVIGNEYFGKNYDTDRVAVLALFHDLPEVYTGDMPTPVKYSSKEMKDIYSKIEQNAVDILIQQLPDSMKEIYSSILLPEGNDKDLYRLVKNADRICAYLKCLEETNSGNKDFSDALDSTKKAVYGITDEETVYFINNFLPAFEKTIDKL